MTSSLTVPQLSTNVPTFRHDFFFSFAKKYINLFVCRKSQDSLTFIQGMKNTQLPTSSIKVVPNYTKVIINLIPFIPFKNYHVKDFLTETSNPFSL